MSAFQNLENLFIFMGNETLSGKHGGSQASCLVTRQLAWIQPVCIKLKFLTQKGLIKHFSNI